MQTRLPSTKNLQAFLATAQHLNFTHAAEALNMTQGAISRQIQSIESLMGVALFYRQARGLALTPEGAKFILSQKKSFIAYKCRFVKWWIVQTESS